MTRFISIIAFLALAACSQQAQKQQVDIKAEELAVRSISMKWLELNKSHDSEGMTTLFADDGIVYRQNQEPKAGVTAIKNFFIRDFEQNPKAISNWNTDRIEISSSGDLAIEYGSWKDTGRGPDGLVDDQGKYVTLYRKVNGVWKVTTDISISTIPVAVTK